MAAGMHQALAGGGPGDARALLHRQGIHVHPQGHQRHPRPLGPQLRQHPRAPHGFAHPPAQGAQLSGNQGGGLLFLAAQFRVGVQVAPQGNQVGQGRLQGGF